MVRGKKDDVIVEGEPMTKEELAAISSRVEGKESPFVDSPVKPAKSTGKYLRSDGQEVVKIGDFRVNHVVGDSQTLKKFKRIMPNFSKPVLLTVNEEQIHCQWVPMTNEEAVHYQKQKCLFGHDSDHNMGLLEVSKANSHGG